MRSIFRLMSFSLVMSFLLLATDVMAAEYHVVIGSFAHESNARRFTATVKKLFTEVSCSYSEHTKLYYVSVLRTANKQDARNLSLYLKREKGFKDAWVLMKPDAEYSVGTRPVVAYARGKARFQASETYDQGIIAAQRVTSSKTEANNNLVDNRLPRVESHAKWTSVSDLAFVSNVDETVVADLLNANTTIVSFIVEDERGRSIPSQVMLVHFEKIKKLATFDTGEKIAIRSTKPNQMVTFVCERLGYSQETRMFNIDHLSRGRDITRNKQGIWEIRIKLKPMELHDIACMNNTTFYDDAAVLQASSRKELDELVLMMQSNPDYKIVLHSHCNSGVKRTIKIPAPENNYFDLDATVQEMASDKKLTKKRAEVVRNYLVSHGVEKKRVHIVAWGSMEPVVSSTSKDADFNERLEIELVE